MLNDDVRLREALEQLLARPEELRPFVNVKEPASQKFVQFAGSQARKLLLDLPLQALTKEEQVRAESFFLQLGQAIQAYEMNDKAGNTVGKSYSFQMQPASVEEAARITRAIFDEIYLLPDCELQVTLY